MADGFFGKLKSVIGIEEESDDDFEREIFESSRPERPVSPASYNGSENDFVQPKVDPSSKVLNMQEASANAQAKKQQIKMLIVEPKDFDDCSKLVDSFRKKKPIIINFEKLRPDVARRIFDFLSGATYAMDGKVQKISSNIFVFAPVNFDVRAVSSEKEENSLGDNSFMRDVSWR